MVSENTTANEKAEDSCEVKTDEDVVPSRRIINVGESVEFRCLQPNYVLSRNFQLYYNYYHIQIHRK
jgi:hypothetical protein